MLPLIGSAGAGILAIVFAVAMILSRSLYTAAICLLVVLLQASALFFFSGAPLLAFLQVMIYAGAVMVLVVLTIMAASGSSRERWGGLSLPRPLIAAGIVLPLIEILALLARGGLAGGPVSLEKAAAQAQVGAVLFGPYAIATEAVGLLLFLSALAMIGVPGDHGQRSRE